MKKNLILFYLILFCALSHFPTNVFAEDALSGEEVSNSKIVFQFSKNIDSAEAFLIQSLDRTREPSQWMGQYFDFGNLGEEHRIGLRKGTFRKEEKTAIYLQPFKESQKILRFTNVPAGSSLQLFYGVQDSEQEQKELNYIYIRVWAGNHLLKRIRVAREIGWKMDTIPLGVISFLSQPVIYSIDVVGDSAEGPSLFFDANIVA